MKVSLCIYWKINVTHLRETFIKGILLFWNSNFSCLGRGAIFFFIFNIFSEIRSVIGFPRGTQSLGVPVSVKVPYRRKAKRILLTNSIDIVYIRVSRTLPRVVQVITQWKRLLKNHYTLVWFAITLVPFICIRSTPTFSKVLQPKVCKASLSCCLSTTAGQATVH